MTIFLEFVAIFSTVIQGQDQSCFITDKNPESLYILHIRWIKISIQDYITLLLIIIEIADECKFDVCKLPDTGFMGE